MSIKRFENILKYLQLSENDNEDQQVLEFVAAVNDQFQKALALGSYITLDASMIKTFIETLLGKIKIIRKPRTMGNEIKNLADPASQIALNLGLYEGKEPMPTKEFVKPFGATTATTLRLMQPYHGKGSREIADSWFGSVKCASELMKQGLYCIMLVKTAAHKDFPQQFLGARSWNVVSGPHAALKGMESNCWLAVSENRRLKILYLHVAPPFQATPDQQAIMGY